MAAEIPFTREETFNSDYYIYGARSRFRGAPDNGVLKNILSTDRTSPYKVSAQFRIVNPGKLLVGIDVESYWTNYSFDIEIQGTRWEKDAKKTVEIFRDSLGGKERIIIIAGKEEIAIDLAKGRSRL